VAFRVRKTEHAGAKHGRGALWGTKYEAKSQSGTIRRRNGRTEIEKSLAEAEDVLAELAREDSKSFK